ncbi:MipA/OmpV family protein [Colwellia sp. TT2012]|uniref:MipA/OmpV family protein n=1 Tax=Colwellia sp. TT2012 TaxID=1720342 RepID=UPI000708B175|nr:MipA/OmpV family protein [Colwellia sp. TT2012]
MKNLIKSTVVSLVATSVILTSFAATAAKESEKKNVAPIEQVKTVAKADKQTETKASAKELEKDTVADKKNHDPDELSFCIGDCDDEKHQAKLSFCIGDCDDEKHQAHSCEDDDDDCETIHRFFQNRRDGFYVDVSAISSVGDDYANAVNADTESEFDVTISYRVQLLGLFIESPGISTRRIQGMYSMPAWGVNFYNSEDYSFDLFYQYSTRGIEGLAGIQSRNEDERAGLRMTGFYDNSQLQMIYSPVSRNGQGSDGIEASISYSYNWQYRNTNFYTNLGLQYRSKEVTPYGVQTWADDNLSTKDGLSYSAELGVEYPLTTDWVIGSYVGYNALSERSIAARQDTVEDGYRAGLLLTFIF